MKKYEYNDLLKVLYKSTKKEPFFVDVPKMNYITYLGTGHPAGEFFQDACNTLFNLAYIIKFKIARDKKDIDYKVNPLEVSWYLDKSDTQIKFEWRAMIMQPEFINEKDYIAALELSRELGKNINYDKAKFEAIDFGKSIQCFHLGDYNNMNSTMYKMQALAKENKLCYELYTHDVYLNDSRKTKTENLKTIMRIAVTNRTI